MSGSSENEEGAEASEVLEEPERPTEWTSGWDDECNDVEDDPDPHGAWKDRGTPLGKGLEDTRGRGTGPRADRQGPAPVGAPATANKPPSCMFWKDRAKSVTSLMFYSLPERYPLKLCLTRLHLVIYWRPWELLDTATFVSNVRLYSINHVSGL